MYNVKGIVGIKRYKLTFLFSYHQQALIVQILKNVNIYLLIVIIKIHVHTKLNGIATTILDFHNGDTTILNFFLFYLTIGKLYTYR